MISCPRAPWPRLPAGAPSWRRARACPACAAWPVCPAARPGAVGVRGTLGWPLAGGGGHSGLVCPAGPSGARGGRGHLRALPGRTVWAACGRPARSAVGAGVPPTQACLSRARDVRSSCAPACSWPRRPGRPGRRCALLSHTRRSHHFNELTAPGTTALNRGRRPKPRSNQASPRFPVVVPVIVCRVAGGRWATVHDQRYWHHRRSVDGPALRRSLAWCMCNHPPPCLYET